MRVIIGCIALILAHFPAQAQTILLLSDPFCPYACDSRELPGYAVELARDSLADAGHKVEVALVPWERALSMVKEGRATGLIGASIRDDRPFVWTSEEIGVSRVAVFTKAGDAWRYQKPDDLAGRILGAVQGYDYDDEIAKYIGQHRADRGRIDFSTGDQALDLNLKKLIAGRVGAVIDDENVVMNRAAQFGMADQIRSAGYTGAPDRLFVGFAKQDPRSPALADALSKGVAARRADGRLKALLARYGLSDWKPGV